MATKSSSDEFSFPIKGSLRRHPFPRLMREIARKRSTGSLYLLSGQTKKVVFFEKGDPVFVRSNVLTECLGQVLAEVGLITQEQCEQTLEAIRRTGKKQGELLVEMGILSDGNLRYGLEAQLRQKLYDIFSWEDGRYQFKAGPSKQVFMLRLDASAEGVIVDAIQDRYTEDRATKALSPYLAKYPVNQTNGKSLGLLQDEQYYLDCLDGSRTVQDVLGGPSGPSIPTPSSLLWGLMQAGVVRVAESSQPARDPPATPTVADLATDEELDPGYEASTGVTEYEDTPLPGELPKPPNIMGDDDFDEDEISEPVPTGEMATDVLVAAEPEGIEEIEDIELLDDDVIELMEDEEENVDGDQPVENDLALEAAPDEPTAGLLDDAGAPLTASDELMDFDDLDGIDLGGDEDASDDTPAQPSDAPSTPPEDPIGTDGEMLAAMRFNEGETALTGQEFERAADLLEEAYENGFDVAELHAMLAYARYMAGDGGVEISQHALELLDYAEEMNPTLDLVHAYRGAVLRGMGDPARARISLERALEINPYCELAMQIMDSLG